ncbi:hypothetical protein RSAG8_09543, partial [Rhizoctonia solani AG-8 WAC10335]
MQSAAGRKPNGRLKIKVEQATCDQCRLNKVQCLAPESVEERCKQYHSVVRRLRPTAQDEPPVLHSAPELLKQVRQVSLHSGSKHPSNLKNDVYWSATASTKAEEPRFHGTSSGEILLRDAKEIRREYLPSAGSGKILRRRQQFWEPPPPEKRCRDAELAPVELPPPDLVDSLVELFFRYTNAFYPIFHRGRFEHELARGTHLASDTRGRTFARVLLLVCAVASRWSSDPRVFTDGQTLSAGCEFFRRVGPVTWAVRAQPSLYDVQICILSALFLHGSSAHYSSWTVLGIGIRLAQDVGAHRKRETVTVENELYKRAFWTLLVLDRMICGALGRTSAMQDLDSDLDPIIELDDEDWPIDGDPFRPLGKPSRLSYFNGAIGLSRILGRALQTLYALDRAKRQMGLIGPEKDGELLADLQRHLEQWKKTVPDHLQAAFSSGMVLIFDILAGEKASRNDQNDPCASTEDEYSKSDKEADVERCRAVLERAASRWFIFGQWQDTLREFQQSGNTLVPAAEPEPALEAPSSEIHEPYAGGSGIGYVPGPGDPYPFSFSVSPHYSQSYGLGQASDMADSVPATAPISSAATPGMFTQSFTTPPDPSSTVHPQAPYLPDAHYGDNTNVPFPGFVPQFNFAPNQGRDDESGWGRQTPASQWQRHVYNPRFQGGTGSQPQ